MSVSMVFITPTRCITPSPPLSPNPSGFTMQDTPIGTPIGTVSPVTYKFPVLVPTKPPTFADEHARHAWKKFHKNDNTRHYTENQKGFKRTKN